MLSIQPVKPAELEPFVPGGSQLWWHHNKKTNVRLSQYHLEMDLNSSEITVEMLGLVFFFPGVCDDVRTMMSC